MTTQKVFSSRALNVDATTYVGEKGRLFYSQPAGTGTAPVLKYSDGSTPGGIPIGGNGGLTTATVNTMIANSLTNYATQTYVTTRGYITADLFTTTNISTFINDAHYIQNETGVNSVVGTANQVIVTDLGGRNIRLSTPQNLNTTATVQFGDLTVQNISVLGTSTNLISNIVQGYRLYLASSATNLSQINGGGIQLGSTATGVHSIFWNSGGYWDTDGDGIKTLTLQATTSTLGTLEVLNQARFGYVNQDLTLANAYIQVDSNTNNFSQIAMVNHNTGTNASADIVATNDTGNDSTGFIDMGINSSIFSTSSWTVNGANDGYLYVAGGDLAIGTDQVGGEIKTFLGPTASPTVVSVATSTQITYSVDLVPSADAVYDLGKPGLRWRTAYVGTGSLYIQDVTTRLNAEITVDNGILFVNGISGLRLGNIQITTSGLTTNVGSQNITLGAPGDTGYVELYRGVQYSNGSLQTVAWNSTATVLYNQITGVPGFATTATVNTLIANSLTNFVYTGTVKLSVTTAASGTSALSFTTSTGVFTYTPPNLSAYLTTVTNVAYANTATTSTSAATAYSTVAAHTAGTGLSGSTFNGSTAVTWTLNTSTLMANAVSATTATNAGYAYSFNTGTLVTTAVTANTVAGGYVSSITAGTGTQVSTSTGAVTIWTLPAQAITTTATSTSTTGLTVDFSGPSFITWQPTSSVNKTITLSGFTPGRKVELWVTPHAINDIFTVTGVTTGQCSDGVNTFTLASVGASQQKSFILQIYCTTNAIGGVWIYGNGTL